VVFPFLIRIAADTWIRVPAEAPSIGSAAENTISEISRRNPE